ncbi:MAG: thioredoxin family protein [Chthoniobacterales bacterium]|nr:thioredoxin family protein [Chthoniobacterales bacterium]
MKALSIATALVLSAASLFAKPGWSEDYAASLAKAKADNKLVLLDFTGSDWCGWCIKIDNEIFSKPEFQAYAKDNLELVELDFPRGKTLPDKVKAQNEKLAQEFGIQGFPTIIVLNSKGKPVGKLGYMPGGPEAFIAELEKLKNK